MPKFSFGLFLLWAVLLVVGVTADATSGERAHVVSVCGRMGSSLVLVVAAWSWVLAARSRRDLPFCVFIAVGMTAGFLGDLLLAESQLRVHGKGNKIRFSPLAPETIQLLDHYLRLERPDPCSPHYSFC